MPFRRLAPLGLLCALSLSSLAHAADAQLWLSWRLTLGTHAPPTHFVVSVTSPDVPDTPLPMQTPWASCPAVPGAQHCAPIGCPGVGTYTFWVQAQYTDGLSARSELATCRSGGRLACTCLAPEEDPRDVQPDPPPDLGPALPPDPDPPGDLPLSEEVPPLSSEVPPLPQQDASGLNLRDPSEGLPGVSRPPPVPACERYCDSLR